MMFFYLHHTLGNVVCRLFFENCLFAAALCQKNILLFDFISIEGQKKKVFFKCN